MVPRWFPVSFTPAWAEWLAGIDFSCFAQEAECTVPIREISANWVKLSVVLLLHDLHEFPGSTVMESATERIGPTFTPLCLLLLCGLSSGCAAVSVASPMSAAEPALQAARPSGAAPEGENPGIALVSCPADVIISSPPFPGMRFDRLHSAEPQTGGNAGASPTGLHYQTRAVR